MKAPSTTPKRCGLERSGRRVNVDVARLNQGKQSNSTKLIAKTSGSVDDALSYDGRRTDSSVSLPLQFATRALHIRATCSIGAPKKRRESRSEPLFFALPHNDLSTPVSTSSAVDLEHNQNSQRASIKCHGLTIQKHGTPPLFRN